MQELIAAMDKGIQDRDADAIREAAKRAKMYAEMMDKEHGEYVLAAIDEARKHAKEIVKAVKERGDAAVSVVLSCDSEARKTALRAARAAFLDVDFGEPGAVEALPVTSARALDVESGEEEEETSASGFEPDYLGDPDATRAMDEDAKAAAHESDKMEA